MQQFSVAHFSTSPLGPVRFGYRGCEQVSPKFRVLRGVCAILNFCSGHVQFWFRFGFKCSGIVLLILVLLILYHVSRTFLGSTCATALSVWVAGFSPKFRVPHVRRRVQSEVSGYAHDV